MKIKKRLKKITDAVKAISDRAGLSDSIIADVERAREARMLSGPPPPGAPLLCSLGIIVEHSGIYLGGGRVAELSGDGRLREVSLTAFLNGDENDRPGPRTGKTIYVACDKETGKPLGSQDSVESAHRFIGEHAKIDYNIITNNCHLFTASCIMGDLQNRKGEASQNDYCGSLWISRVDEALHAMADDEASSIMKLENVIASRLNGGKPISWLGVASMAGFRYELSPRKIRQLAGKDKQQETEYIERQGNNDTSSV